MKKMMATACAFAYLSGTAFAAGVEYQNSGGPAAAVESQGVQLEGSPENWGSASRVAATYVGFAFNPINTAVTYDFGTLGGNLALFRTNPTGAVWMEAPINIPSGARIEMVEFRFCDTSITKAFFSFLTINNKSGTVSQPALVQSTNAENIGCVNRTFTLSPALTVDNDNNAYSLEVNLGGNGTAGDNTIVLAHARVYYRLQVSAAPATATFPNDVPTSHPFFRFVEALAAAGISGGCSAGSFCPDSPVTRGQMAVFLATSLGLHFPN